MIAPYDAWALRSLISGRDLNGQVEAVSGNFREIAERMAKSKPEVRVELWNVHLSEMPDAPFVVKALAEVDPDAAPPDVSTEQNDKSEWGPIRIESLPPPEPFPLDVFPESIARLAIEGAAAIGCPVDFFAVTMLVVAAGAIGRSVSLMLKPEYFASSSLFAACVGPPSDGKTPAFKIVASAIRRIDAILTSEHAKAIIRWEEENRTKPGEPKVKPPAPPRPRRIDVDDITMEAIPLRLADNPRGLVMLRDELTAFLQGMNQYKGGKGNDRSVALKIWSGDAIKKDRVSDEMGIPIRCKYPCMSIVGGLPPDMLGTLQDAKGSADGFVDRFLFAYPESIPIPEWSEGGVSPDLIEYWGKVIASLWSRPLSCHEGKDCPHVAQFTLKAREAWQRLYNAHAAEMNDPAFPSYLRGAWGKLREYAGRLALVIACLDHAVDPELNPVDVPKVDHIVVEKAWRLIAYFKSQVRRVHIVIHHGNRIGGSPTAKTLVDWIKEGNRTSFSIHDVKQARRGIDEEDLAPAIIYLVERNVIRPLPTTQRAGPGRPPSPVYEVNPGLWESRNPGNPQ